MGEIKFADVDSESDDTAERDDGLSRSDTVLMVVESSLVFELLYILVNLDWVCEFLFSV